MNPRVSRSSALASKATGFPIAKIAAKLAVGYRLHELPNDITRETMACFEPTIDYVVTKVPRFAFEKFPEADPELTTQMKSVGETMAIGRTFKESFQKALRGLEVGSFGFGCDGKDLWGTPEQPSIEEVCSKLVTPGHERVWYLRYAIKYGLPLEEIYELTGIDPWFLENLQEIVEMEEHLRAMGGLKPVRRRHAAPRQAVRLFRPAVGHDLERDRDGRPPGPQAPRHRGHVQVGRHVRGRVRGLHALLLLDLRGRGRDAARRSPGQRRVIILGGGPNRIGQGIEFDYCCCHASFALRELGIESIMVNSNPETVSTDYDTSDLLFFEPLTTEDVLNICDRVEPDGVIVQFGGQTPLNLARALSNAGVPIIGTSVDTIEDAEDREKFKNILHRLGLKQPASGIARNMSQARTEVATVGFPALVRPSFVLGGRAMEICYDVTPVRPLRGRGVRRGPGPAGADRPLPRRRHRGRRGRDRRRPAGDRRPASWSTSRRRASIRATRPASSRPTACRPPSWTKSARPRVALAQRLQVRGLMNVQYAVKREDGHPNVYVLEVNPRASRTVPFVSKATGMPLAKAAAKVMVGVSLAEQGYFRGAGAATVLRQGGRLPLRQVRRHRHRARAGNEIDRRGDGHQRAAFRSPLPRASWPPAPCCPRAARSLSASPIGARSTWPNLARRLERMGFELLATRGTAQRLEEAGIRVQSLMKLQEGHPNVLDYMIDGNLQLVINTPSGKGARTDEGRIRAAAVSHGVPCITTLEGADGRRRRDGSPAAPRR